MANNQQAIGDELRSQTCATCLEFTYEDGSDRWGNCSKKLGQRVNIWYAGCPVYESNQKGEEDNEEI